MGSNFAKTMLLEQHEFIFQKLKSDYLHNILQECSRFSKFNLAWQLNGWDFKSIKPPIWSVFSQPECEQTNQHPWKRERRELWAGFSCGKNKKAAARRRDSHWCCFSRSFIGTVKNRASNMSHDLTGRGHLFPSIVYRLTPRWTCEIYTVHMWNVPSERSDKLIYFIRLRFFFALFKKLKSSC